MLGKGFVGAAGKGISFEMKESTVHHEYLPYLIMSRKRLYNALSRNPQETIAVGKYLEDEKLSVV